MRARGVELEDVDVDVEGREAEGEEALAGGSPCTRFGGEDGWCDGSVSAGGCGNNGGGGGGGGVSAGKNTSGVSGLYTDSNSSLPASA